MSLWTNESGTLLVDSGGSLIDCDHCPCDAGCPSGQALYKIKYAELDPECGSSAENRYRLNISCSCKCLIAGAVPSPLPAGKVAEDYHDSYPITGQTGESPNIVYWKKSIAGGPFTDDAGAKPPGKTAQQKCDAFPVEGCAGFTGCNWYRLRTSFAQCDGVADPIYCSTPLCSVRCLLMDDPIPSPPPAGRTLEDYYLSYPIEDFGVSLTEIISDALVATCDHTAEQVGQIANDADDNCSRVHTCPGDVIYGYIYVDITSKDRPFPPITYCYGGRSLYPQQTSMCDAQPADNEDWYTKRVFGKYPITYAGQWECEKRWYVVKNGTSDPPASCPQSIDGTAYYTISQLHPIIAAGYPWAGFGARHEIVSEWCTEAEAEANLP